MALAVGATMAQGPVTINGAQAVAKSYPGFLTICADWALGEGDTG